MAVTELGATTSRRTFEEFHARRAGDALRYAAAIVGQREAEDACQEAWLRIWRSWGRSDPDRLDAWAFRIVRNCALDRGRSQSRARTTEPLGEIDPPATSEVEDVVMPRIEAEGALRLLSQLSVPLRETLWLREVGGLSYAEIAEVQTVSIGTVMSRLHAARKRMAKHLAQQGSRGPGGVAPTQAARATQERREQR
jgi:RNA polymerase sigma-70 factor (ECF subfamily)